jgi:uncharacterized SAM-binding protein YcdF (DUF218 family)
MRNEPPCSILPTPYSLLILKSSISKSRIIISSLLLIVVVMSVTTCRKAGTWLVKNDTLRHADVMVILMGNIPDRVLQAADLYNRGIAGRVIIVEESMGAFKKLEERGAHIISNTMQARNAAVSLGIPADSILILPGYANSTQKEAIIIREYLTKRSDIDTLLLVTSAPHTRRASIIFRKAFEANGNKVLVCSSPSIYSNYTGVGWWKHKEEIQAVLGEYVKLVNFWLFDKRRL